MELLTVDLGSRGLLICLFDLRMVVGVGVAMELPDIDAIVLCG